jgi:hypothetical protein
MDPGAISRASPTRPLHHPYVSKQHQSVIMGPEKDVLEPVRHDRATELKPSRASTPPDTRGRFSRAADKLYLYTVPRSERTLTSYLFFGATGTAAFGYLISPPIAGLYLTTYIAVPFLVHYFSTEHRHD